MKSHFFTYKTLKTLLIIIASAAALLSFSSCEKKTYTPALESEYNLRAVYKTGDFSYSCRIVKEKGSVLIEPLSTSAAGMKIKCDGANVYFIKDSLTKSFSRDEIDATNPAVVLFDVFSSVENAQQRNVKIKNNDFYYSGTSGAGAFTLVQSKSNALKSISVPDAEIEIKFE